MQSFLGCPGLEFFIGMNLIIHLISNFHPIRSQEELMLVPSFLQDQQATLCFGSLLAQAMH